MNFDNPIAALFPGAAGRTVSELTRRHLLGEESAPTSDVAAGAAVAPEQFVKVATRLAMMGLVRFPVREEVSMVRGNIMWDALAGLLHPNAQLDSLVRKATAHITGLESLVIGGPVPAGTAESFPEGMTVALVVPVGDVSEEDRVAVSRTVSDGLGNDCSVVIVHTADEAAELVPEDGRRVVGLEPDLPPDSSPSAPGAP